MLLKTGLDERITTTVMIAYLYGEKNDKD